MILYNTEELNLMLKIRVDDFDYTVHVSSEMMKCFGCGVEGHLIRTCSQKKDAGTYNETAAPGPEQEDTHNTQQTEQQGDAGSGCVGSQAAGSGDVGTVFDNHGAADPMLLIWDLLIQVQLVWFLLV